MWCGVVKCGVMWCCVVFVVVCVNFHQSDSRTISKPINWHICLSVCAYLRATVSQYASVVEFDGNGEDAVYCVGRDDG
jgi:hypothetical protein